MKITKRQLRRIIKEEKARILKEAEGDVTMIANYVRRGVKNYINQTEDAEGVIEDLQAMIAEIETTGNVK